MTAHPTMNDLFQRLDKWRHFPAFPLEARSEVLFALFLPISMKKCLDVDVNPVIIPQFPLKKEECSNQSDNQNTSSETYRSFKVDFFALSECGKKGYFIELKTDMKSRRSVQDKYLNKAMSKSMCVILSELKEIVKRSKEKQKYYHLLNALSDLGLIRLYDLESKIYPKVISGVSSLIDDISILKTPDLKVVYIQPRKHCNDKPDDKHHYIYFKEFAKIVENQGELGKQFARYLREWKTDPAIQPPD